MIFKTTREEALHELENYINNDIVNSLNKKGSKAISINSKENNIIQVTPDNPQLGYVGVPNYVDTNKIKEITNKKQIPVVAPLGVDENNQVYNIT